MSPRFGGERRPDLSEWVLHFVRGHRSDDEHYYDLMPFERYEGFPYHEDPKVSDRFFNQSPFEEDFPGWSELGSFPLLKKIIRDGHIRTSWSFRRGMPTIYGPRAAVCLTEMPLYALMEYAKVRRAEDVSVYAIGVLKRELFQAGGRPAIYGVSAKHKDEPRKGEHTWPRKLDPSCGISEAEQYRYVFTNLRPDSPIDWLHEREWRWADHEDRLYCPGLPVWLDEVNMSFSRALVVVRTRKEADQVLDLLKQLYDSGVNHFWEFNRTALRGTSVLPLEDLSRSLSESELSTVRLEDVPAPLLRDFASPLVDECYVARVKLSLSKAKDAATEAAEAFLQIAPRTEGGYVADLCGFANVLVSGPQTAFVAALQELGRTYVAPGGGYVVQGLQDGSWTREQAISVKVAAMRAAKETLESDFPDVDFSVRDELD